MKLVTFQVKTVFGRFCRLGAIAADEVIDLNAAYKWHLNEQGDPEPETIGNLLLPADMLTFLENGNRTRESARLLLELYKHGEFNENTGINGEKLFFKLDDVTLKAPLMNPPALRDFLAFEQHTANGAKTRNEPVNKYWYEIPVYYKGNHRSIIGPDETVLWPSYTRRMDYELELACIIGKKGRNIPEGEAKHYIAGYTIMNDFSARDIQKKEMACRLGPAKGKDFATAIGPYIVTPEEASPDRVDKMDLKMTARINGEVWSEGNFNSIHWTFEQMIAHVSKEETIYPGDVFGSGTVGFGCGFELDKWLQPGDLVELKIEKLGVLRNRVGQPQSAGSVEPVLTA